MKGVSDPFGGLRDTQAKAWPSARDVALVGEDYYGDRGPGGEDAD